MERERAQAAGTWNPRRRRSAHPAASVPCSCSSPAVPSLFTLAFLCSAFPSAGLLVAHWYEYYFALLRDFPQVKFTLNGGITTIDQVSLSIRQGANGVMVGRADYNNPWNMLGHVDGEIYGKPTKCISRRQILKSYQVYGDSIIGQYGPSRPNVRQLVKTVKSFLEETLDAIPDSVLDKPVTREQSIEERYFADVDSLLPPRYTALTNCSYGSAELVTAST